MTVRSLLLSALMVLVVRIPFDFRAGGRHFGPGAYVLTLEGEPIPSLAVQSADKGERAVLGVRRSDEPAEAAPTVTFHAYGDRRFLAAVQVAPGRRFEVVPSAAEAAAARAQGAPTLTRLRAEIPGARGAGDP